MAPFMGPKEVSLLTGQSIPTSRKQLSEIKKRIEQNNKAKLVRNLVPTQMIIDYYNIDLDFLEKRGTLDKVIREKGKE
jgi:hypothetical protein